jgi:hypothetical protein
MLIRKELRFFNISVRTYDNHVWKDNKLRKFIKEVYGFNDNSTLNKILRNLGIMLFGIIAQIL